MDSALSKVLQLQPRSFEFDTTNYGYMGFTGGKTFGLVAQDVENIIPELVDEIRQPAILDSAGNVVHSGFDYKTVEYNRLIPFLIKGIQDQQARIDSLEAEVDSIELEKDSLLSLIEEQDSINTVQDSMINAIQDQVDTVQTDSSILARLEAVENCMNNLPPGLGCEDSVPSMKSREGKNPNSVTVQTTVKVQYDESLKAKETELDQNRPNPFRYSTTFSYDLAEAGMIELTIHDQSGRYIDHVVNERQEAGHHEVKWNATDLEPGIYYYTLKVDGMEWVKKAIKLK